MNVRQLQHLAAALAHEVRNPLNSMAIHIELVEGRLGRSGELDRAAALRSMTVLAGEIERVDKILEEYLRYAGPEEAARNAIEPRALVDAALERASARAAARGVRLEGRAASGQPRWAVDGDAVGEALDALLANALDASERGGAVVVDARSDGDDAIVTVTDGGAGIASEDLARVFHLGFSRRGQAGIGLTVAKQIVKGHGGSIAVESRPGMTVFTVRLPLEADA
jgi:signal transduction histidine kinase